MWTIKNWPSGHVLFQVLSQSPNQTMYLDYNTMETTIIA